LEAGCGWRAIAVIVVVGSVRVESESKKGLLERGVESSLEFDFDFDFEFG
jgi:hypothetical protein